MAIIVFIGESGSGKNSVLRELIAKGVLRGLVTSTTTRARRESDHAGEYVFCSVKEFAALEAAQAFAWPPVTYAGNRYGFQNTHFRAASASKDHYAITIVPQVLRALLDCTKNVRILFIDTPQAIMEERMHSRGDAPEKIAQRVSTFGTFHKGLDALNVPYDTVDNSGDLAQAVAQASEILDTKQV